MIPADDRGLLLGDGLFETLLARDGRLADLDAHLDRMAAGCDALGLGPLDRWAAQDLLEAAAAEIPHGLAAVRLTLTAGSGGRGLDRPPAPAPRLFARAHPYASPTDPVRLGVAEIRRNETSPASRCKTLAVLDQVLARRQAQNRGYDDAVMLNTRGEAACATAANVFWSRGGRLETPALGCGVLDGIMRRRVMACAEAIGAPVAEVAAPLARVQSADFVFLTNSLMGIRAVAALGEIRFGPLRLDPRLLQA